MNHQITFTSHHIVSLICQIAAVVCIPFISLDVHAASVDSSANIQPFTTAAPPQIRGQYLKITTLPSSRTNEPDNFNNNNGNPYGTPNVELKCPANSQLLGIEERYSSPSGIPGTPGSGSSSSRTTLYSTHFRYAPYCDFANSTSNYQCWNRKWHQQYYRQDGLRLRCISNTFEWENVAPDGTGQHLNYPVANNYNL